MNKKYNQITKKEIIKELTLYKIKEFDPNILNDLTFKKKKFNYMYKYVLYDKYYTFQTTYDVLIDKLNSDCLKTIYQYYIRV